jgi:hypothetical protein
MTPRLLIAVIGLAVTLGYVQAQAPLGAETHNYPKPRDPNHRPVPAWRPG